MHCSCFDKCSMYWNISTKSVSRLSISQFQSLRICRCQFYSSSKRRILKCSEYFYFFYILQFHIFGHWPVIFTWHRFTHLIDFIGTSRPNVSHFCGQKNSPIKAWGSQTKSIKSLESQTQHKNNWFSVKAKFKLFFRQTSLHQNVKHLVGLVSGY